MTKVDHLYIVGAGFSYNAGLPLAAGFTQRLLDVKRLKPDSQSAILVDCIRVFVNDVFGAGSVLDPSEWPQLEDLFTTIDLAANTGHHLGSKYAASDLRTIRRALIVRLTRMLWQSFSAKQKKPDSAWDYMRQFFSSVPVDHTAFLSMNWDTVIEELLRVAQNVRNIDYGCSAIAAVFKKGAVEHGPHSASLKLARILKPHGSVNWMYCDACSRLYWFPPSDTESIGSRLFKEGDREVVHRLIAKSPPRANKPAQCPDCQAQALGTRFATFSYRKALEFPMHHSTWRTAEEFLQTARSWIFIGYSMPAADYQFKYLLKRVQLSRRTPPEILIVTKGASGDPTVENYRRFFGSATIPDSNILTDGMNVVTLDKLRKMGALRPT